MKARNFRIRNLLAGSVLSTVALGIFAHPAIAATDEHAGDGSLASTNSGTKEAPGVNAGANQPQDQDQEAWLKYLKNQQKTWQKKYPQDRPEKHQLTNLRQQETKRNQEQETRLKKFETAWQEYQPLQYEKDHIGELNQQAKLHMRNAVNQWNEQQRQKREKTDQRQEQQRQERAKAQNQDEILNHHDKMTDESHADTNKPSTNKTEPNKPVNNKSTNDKPASNKQASDKPSTGKHDSDALCHQAANTEQHNSDHQDCTQCQTSKVDDSCLNAEKTNNSTVYTYKNCDHPQCVCNAIPRSGAKISHSGVSAAGHNASADQFTRGGASSVANNGTTGTRASGNHTGVGGASQVSVRPTGGAHTGGGFLATR